MRCKRARKSHGERAAHCSPASSPAPCCCRPLVSIPCPNSCRARAEGGGTRVGARRRPRGLPPERARTLSLLPSFLRSASTKSRFKSPRHKKTNIITNSAVGKGRPRSAPLFLCLAGDVAPRAAAAAAGRCAAYRTASISTSRHRRQRRPRRRGRSLCSGQRCRRLIQLPGAEPASSGCGSCRRAAASGRHRGQPDAGGPARSRAPGARAHTLSASALPARHLPRPLFGPSEGRARTHPRPRSAP